MRNQPTAQRRVGLLVDMASGDVIDAGALTTYASGHVVVTHVHRDSSQRDSSYLPNPNHAVLAVPAPSIN